MASMARAAGRNRSSTSGVAGRLAVGLALLFCLLPASAPAHTQPRPIEQWGPFVPEIVTCLQLMTRATHVCFDKVLAVENRCRDQEVRGETCDRDAVEDEVEAATNEMRRELTSSCLDGQLTELGYFGFFDTEADLFNACLIQSRAAVEATYAPALAGPPSAAEADCMAASADYGRKVMSYILQRVIPVQERIATIPFKEDEKKAFVLHVEMELSATRQQHWIAGLSAACPDFAAVYGRSADSFLRTLKQRTDCVLSKTYVNTSFNCLGQVCGNGIKEASEACDDGNRDDTDTCKSNCTANPSP
jgi:cysteine-rich repeat protein